MRYKRLLLEFTGSLGDLGTFLPIACGLILINKVNATALFLTAALLYIAAGSYFRVPVPVQPLKATSALAVAIGASASTISLVAFFMSITLIVVWLLKLDRLIGSFFPRQIIRGIQLGLAFILIKSGLKLILGGGIPSVVLGNASLLNVNQAFFLLFLPQLPLTLANSIYATADTAKTYFGDKSSRVTARALAISLSIANLFSGLVGGVPLCHGSSGVTAHHRFGARSGLCGLFAGFVFIIIAVAFKLGFCNIIKFIPFWILGLSLIYIGIRHAALIKDIIFVPEELVIALSIGVYSLITGNLAIAFCLGIILNLMRERARAIRLYMPKGEKN